jgi:hypothetical protein
MYDDFIMKSLDSQEIIGCGEALLCIWKDGIPMMAIRSAFM